MRACCVGYLFCGAVLGTLSSLKKYFAEEKRFGFFTLIVVWPSDSVFSLAMTSCGP